MQSSNLNTQSGLLSGEIRRDLPWRLHVCQLLWGLSGCRSSLELFWSRMTESHCRYLACRVSHAVLLLPPLLLLWSCLLSLFAVLSLAVLCAAGKLPSPHRNLLVYGFPLTVSLLAVWGCTLGAFLVWACLVALTMRCPTFLVEQVVFLYLTTALIYQNV